ncbi:MAG: hypothetical protein Q8Q13_00480 [bacterium]|nr:hypothetical protein [bacterium]
MASYKTVKLLSREEAAYLAGIIDGEGTITLTRRNKNEQRQLVVSISNCELPLLKYIARLVGTGIIVTKHILKSNHSQGYAFNLKNRQALDVVRMTYPFLRTYKQQRAALILKDYLRLTPRNGKYSAVQLAERDRFVEKFFLPLPHNTKTR